MFLILKLNNMRKTLFYIGLPCIIVIIDIIHIYYPDYKYIYDIFIYYFESDYAYISDKPTDITLTTTLHD